MKNGFVRNDHNKKLGLTYILVDITRCLASVGLSPVDRVTVRISMVAM